MKDIIEIYYRNWNKSVVRLMAEIDDNYKNCLYIIAWVDDFKGKGCIYITNENICLYNADINKMNQTLEGTCHIKDVESDSFIEISFEKDILVVRGLISDYKNKLLFEFEADQTVLKQLLVVMNKLKT